MTENYIKASFKWPLVYFSSFQIDMLHNLTRNCPSVIKSSRKAARAYFFKLLLHSGSNYRSIATRTLKEIMLFAICSVCG